MGDHPYREPPPEGTKQLVLRLDPDLHAALARWAADDLRSPSAQAAILLRDALVRAGRL